MMKPNHATTEAAPPPPPPTNPTTGSSNPLYLSRYIQSPRFAGCQAIITLPQSNSVQLNPTMRSGWRQLVATTFPLPALHFNEDFPPFVIRHAQPRPGHSPTQSNPVQPSPTQSNPVKPSQTYARPTFGSNYALGAATACRRSTPPCPTHQAQRKAPLFHSSFVIRHSPPPPPRICIPSA